MIDRIEKKYRNTKFAPALIRRVKALLQKDEIVDGAESYQFSAQIERDGRTTHYTNDKAGFEGFLRDLETELQYARLDFRDSIGEYNFWLHYMNEDGHSVTRVSIQHPDIEKMNQIIAKFDSADPSDKQVNTAEKRPVAVFLGHGRSPAWRELKDHLSDQHGYEVVAYETGARAGHSIRDILDEMADDTNIAFLVHTADDEMGDGSRHARLNVVHETGLFQGKLGFAKGIVLLEDGCSLFSNLDGVQQIRFSKGNIRETFGDVLATLKREFP